MNNYPGKHRPKSVTHFLNIIYQIQANKTRMNAAVQSAATEVAMQAQQASKKSGWSPHAMVRT